MLAGVGAVPPGAGRCWLARRCRPNGGTRVVTAARDGIRRRRTADSAGGASMSCRCRPERADHHADGAARSADCDQQDQPGAPAAPGAVRHGRRLPSLAARGRKHRPVRRDGGGRGAAAANGGQAFGQLTRGDVPGEELRKRGLLFVGEARREFAHYLPGLPETGALDGTEARTVLVSNLLGPLRSASAYIVEGRVCHDGLAFRDAGKSRGGRCAPAARG
jgi:hypothetical protein